MVPAALVAGVVLVLAACTQQISQQTQSPEASPSTPTANTTPSTAPTPGDSPTPVTVPPPAASPSPARLIITSVAFHMGEVGLTYGSVTAKASGGVKPYKWSISSGALPGGLVLSTGGTTSGKPTAAGTFSFVIRVDDSAAGAAGVSRSIFVFRQIYFTAARATCLGTYLTGCKTTLSYKGGAGATPKVTFTLNAGDPPLPTGSTVTVKSGIVTVNIAPPQCQYSGAVMTLVLHDQSPCTVGYRCTSAPAVVDITLTSGC